MNRMRANGRNLIAQLTQRELSFEVLPTMYDDATVRAAHLAETLLRETCTLHNWETKREELVAAVLKGGTAAVCVDWDKETQQTVEQVFEWNLITDYQKSTAPIVLMHFIVGILVNGHYLVQISCFDSDKGGHNLRCARHRQGCLAIHIGQCLTCVGIEEVGCSCADGRRFRFRRKHGRGCRS